MSAIEYFVRGNVYIVAVLPILVVVIDYAMYEMNKKQLIWKQFCLFYLATYSWAYIDKEWVIYTQLTSFFVSVIIILIISRGKRP